MEIKTNKPSSQKLDGNLERFSQEIVATIRINPKSYNDAYINNPDGGSDIYLDGIKSRNFALEGDLVGVRLYHSSRWKINYNTIANRWNEWSSQLLPIIENIEKNELQQAIKAPPCDQFIELNVSNCGPDETSPPVATDTVKAELSHRQAKLSRKKRSPDNGTNRTSQGHAEVTASKLPSNLPSGLSKLKLEHILPLPFSSQCIQKTGYVSRVIRRNHSGIAGGYLKEYSDEFALFSPVDARIPRFLINIMDCPLDFRTQSKRYKDILFVAQLTGWEEKKKFATGNLVRIVGNSNTIESRMETLLLEQNVYDEDFPPDAYAELEYLKNLPNDWFELNSKGRMDLTNECVFTIDPKTARDLDDALSIKKIGEEVYEIGVHIADVSHFVKELSAVDYYARLRTTSVYLVDRVIPMLPRILCEAMCSLNPDEPKLTFSVIWKMDKYGRIIDEWFGKTIIKSCLKLAYEQAQDMIDNPKDLSWIQEGQNMPNLTRFSWAQISRSVNTLNMIAINMRRKRFDGGALRIEQVKLKFELDQATGVPSGFSFEQRSDANYLIEEFMLAANMAVAKRIYKHSKELALLRRHPVSSATRLKEVKEFCDAKGIPLDIESAGTIQTSLNAITDPTMSKVISFLLLRAMKNAEYVCVGALGQSDTSFSHFALNVSYYTHFTSPIRRYADVIVHRQLAQALGLETQTNEDIKSLSMMADECTKRKISSKLISETSQKLFFNLFVQKAGFCELLASVTRIYDRSFDVILIDYSMSGRVYLDRLTGQLESFKFESFSGVKRLVLNWKPTDVDETDNKKTKKKKKKKKNKAEANYSETQIEYRSNSQTNKSTFSTNNDLDVKEISGNQTVIEVFDVIRVIVTVDDKDIGKLRIDMKCSF